MAGRFQPPSEEAMANFTKSTRSATTTRKTASDVGVFVLYLREALNENRQLENIPEDELAKSLISYIQVRHHLLKHDLNVFNKIKCQFSCYTNN